MFLQLCYDWSKIIKYIRLSVNHEQAHKPFLSVVYKLKSMICKNLFIGGFYM
ncbi:hypothetical protein CLI98_02601 [Bacillus velezensis]|nr:hypothetical protein NG74_00717 [Bacillus velezensis]ATD75844.1 hypothetical protein CLI98_02601 [Bacillus velezensis]